MVIMASQLSVSSDEGSDFETDKENKNCMMDDNKG